MDGPLHDAINRLTDALRGRNAAIGAGWGSVTGLGTALIAMVVARITPLWVQTELLLALVWAVSIGTLAGALLGYAWPYPIPRRLRLFDRRLHLADRLTTGWELAQGHIHAPHIWVQLQQEETLRAIRHVDPRAVFPARPQRSAVIAALGLLIAIVPVILLPNPQEAVLAQRAAQQQATEAAIEQIETAQNTLAEDTTLTETEREAALKTLEDAVNVLKDRDASLEEQHAALAEAEHQLARLRTPETEAQIQRLAESAPLSTAEVVQPLTEALQQGDAEAAAAYLRDLLDPTTGDPLTPEEILALADAFAQMANALQKSDPAMAAQFQRVAQEIYSNDVNGAQEALAQAAATLSEAAQSNAANETLEQTQATLQQAQEGLGNAQTPTTAQTSPNGSSMQPGGTGQQAGQGTSASGQNNTTGSGSGTGSSEHHEDSGSSAPYGANEAARITGSGGEITLPRQEALGPPNTTTGVPGEMRIPYQDVYATYAEAAEANLTQNTYPPTLRSYVREYFSGLEP